MAISSSFYINAPSLASATAIYTDADLTVCADDGYYSDGVISRQQVGCVLLPQQICPSCIPVSYNCIDGTCIDPGDGTGTYSSLVSCESDCSLPCECHDGIINDNNAFSYYDCDGVLFAGGAELGTEICYNINTWQILTHTLIHQDKNKQSKHQLQKKQ